MNGSFCFVFSIKNENQATAIAVENKYEIQKKSTDFKTYRPIVSHLTQQL